MAEHVKSIAALSEPFGDGQRIAAAVIEYDDELAGAELPAAQWEVSGRNIKRVYTSAVPDVSEKAEPGRYVIAELDCRDKNAQTLSDMEGFPRHSVRREMGHGPDGGPPEFILPDGRRYRSPGGIHTKREPLRIKVRQLGSVKTQSGNTIEPWEKYEESDREINKVVDDFIQGQYEDMAYNLFIHAGYDPDKKYPLVLFIHDAGVMGDDPRITLEQGMGATVWAMPENQAEHPCFVLAPQHRKEYAITNDDYEATGELDTIKRLCDHILSEYSIDRSRVYTTGQSMGFMCSVELTARYPDYFAACLAVAGHWDRPRTAQLCDKNVWMFISEEDSKGTAMFVLPEMLKNMGKSMGVYRWSADQSLDELSALVREAASDGEHYRLTIFTGDSIWRRSQPDKTDGGGHSGTWHLVYRIKAVRDWLFAQSL